MKRRYGKWLCTSKRKSTGAPHFKMSVWCQCACGNKAWVREGNLKSGLSTCCLQCGQRKHVTHGASVQSSTPPLHKATYRSWQDMKLRCYKNTCRAYKNYGARGIKVCSSWLDSFESFRIDMGWKPSIKHTIERKDCNGHYTPTNCVWLIASKQNRNKRSTTWLKYRGSKLSLPDMADKYGLNRTTLRTRLNRGWSLARALETGVVGPRQCVR